MSFTRYLSRIRESFQGNRNARRAKKRWNRPFPAFKPRLEVLETRLSPSVDLSQFGSFLSQALPEIQSQGITGQIDSTGLPLIGKQLDQSAPPSAAQFLNPVQVSLQNAFKNVSSNTDEADFKTALNNQLGSDGLLITPVKRISGDPAANSVEYQLTVGVDQAHALNSLVNLDPKLGLPGLNINLGANATAKLNVWYQDTITFGVNNGTYFIDTTKDASGTNNSPLAMHIEVTLAPNASLQGSVGVFQFSATDSGTDIKMNYQGNLTAPNNQLTLTSGFKFDGTTSLDANILLHLKADFGTSTNTSTLESDFVFQWSASAKNPTSLTDFSTAPQKVEFDKVQMKAQAFFQNVVGPIVQQINNVTAPLDPIVNALNQKPLAQLGLDDTYEQILENKTLGLGIKPEDLSYFDTIANFIELASAASKAMNSANGSINLGSFSLADPRSGNGGVASSSPNSNAFGDLQTAAPDFFSALTTEDSGTPNSDDTHPGLHLDFLNDPTKLFQLFVGASSSSNPPPQLISYSLPTLKVGVATGDIIFFSTPLPAFPVLTINVGFRGGIGLVGNLNMGYDAQGLIDYASSKNPKDLLDGLYIDTSQPLLKITGWTKDPSNPNDSGHPSDNIFSFFGNIAFDPKGELSDLASQVGISLPNWFGKAVDAALPIQISAKGELSLDLKGQVDVGLNGGGDNRFRLSQLGSSNLFNVSGFISVGGELTLHAEASANIPTITIHYRNVLGNKIPDGIDIGTRQVGATYDKTLYSFPTIPLFSFGNAVVSGNTVQQPPSDPQLGKFYTSDTKLSDGHQVSAGTLVLNVGPFAGNRGVSPNDTNASYVIHHVSGSSSDPGGETVSIDAYGKIQQFPGVTAIYANTGDDNDSILLDDDVLSPSYLQAGRGTDTLKAGSGAATLVGGSGTDTLIAGPAAGVKNTIQTSTGNTEIVGGAGDDSITIIGNGTNDITGGSGNDTVFESGNSNFSLITDSSGNTQLIGDATSTLNQIKSVQLDGSNNGQSFIVQNWGGAVSLNGSGTGDQFNIALVGSGFSSYLVQDKAGDGKLQVTGSSYGDDFTLKKGSLTDHGEQATYSGIAQLTVQAADDQQEQDNFAILGTIAGTTTIVNGGTNVCQFNVQSISGPTTINTKSGENTINVGSNSPAINGNLSGIQGALTINGSNGTDTANVDDSGASTGQRSGKLTPTTLTGLGMGPNGITFSGLTAFNLNVGPGATTTDTFDITDVNVPSLVTGPRYALFDQNPVGKVAVTGDIGSVHVDDGKPGSLAGPIATVTLFEGYSPWLLHEVIDPPGNNNAGAGGTPSPNPTTPNPSNPQTLTTPAGPVSNGGTQPAEPPATTSTPGAGSQGNTSSDPTAPQGNSLPTSVNVPPATTGAGTPVVGGGLPLAGYGISAPGSVLSPAPDSPLSPFLALFELELKMVQTELTELESIWFQILSNFEAFLPH